MPRDLTECLLRPARAVLGHGHDSEAGLVEVERGSSLTREVGHGEGEDEAAVDSLGVVQVDELAEVAGLDGLVAGMVPADARGVGEPVDDLERTGSPLVGSGEGAAPELGDDEGLSLLMDQVTQAVW